MDPFFDALAPFAKSFAIKKEGNADAQEEETCDQEVGNAITTPSEEPHVTGPRSLEHNKDKVGGHAVKAQSKVQKRKRERQQLEEGPNKNTDNPEVKKKVKEEVVEEMDEGGGASAEDQSNGVGKEASKRREKESPRKKGAPGATVNAKNGKLSEVVVKEEERDDAVPSEDPTVDREQDGGAKIHAKPKRRPSFPVEDNEVDLHQKEENKSVKRRKTVEREDEEDGCEGAKGGRQGKENEQMDGMVDADFGGMDSDINDTQSPLEEKPELESRGAKHGVVEKEKEVVDSDGEEEEKRLEKSVRRSLLLSKQIKSAMEKPEKSRRAVMAATQRLEKEKGADDSDAESGEERVEKPMRRSGRRLPKPAKHTIEKDSDDDFSDDEDEKEQRKRKRRSRSYTSDDGVGSEEAGGDSADGDEEMDQSMDKDDLMDDGNGGNKCPVDGCAERLSSSKDLAKHMRKHPAPLICDVCKSSWSCGWNLCSHYTRHTGERPFKCDTCKKTFKRKRNLCCHQLIHTGELPHKCDVCEYKTSSSSHLKKHYRIHTGEKPFPCTVCKKRFTQSSDLTVHMRQHTGEKPYSCATCGFKAAHSGNLSAQKKRHSH